MDQGTGRPTNRIAFVVLVVVCLLAAGYALGRARFVERLANRLATQASILGSSAGRPSDTNAIRGRTFESLNRALDKRLRVARAEAAVWRGFLVATDRAERQAIAEEIRTGVRSELGPPLGSGVVRAAGVRPLFEREGIAASIVELDLPSGRRIACIQLAPSEGVGPPRAAILVLHGIGGSVRGLLTDIDYHHGIAMGLARGGFFVLAPLRAATTAETRSTIYAKTTMLGLTGAGIEVWPLVGLVDYLSSLETVDAERIGVYGVSQGGRDALWLSALDERISVTVVSAYFTERFPWLLRRAGDANEPPGPGITRKIMPEEIEHFLPAMRYGLDDLNLIAAIQPRPLLLVMGRNDPRYVGSARAGRRARKIYAHVSHPDRLELIEFDGGHETNVEAVLPFLGRWATAARFEGLR